MSDSNILRGPPLLVPECSMAEYLLPKFKSLPKDHIILINGDTGECCTSWQLLTESIHLLEGLKNLGFKQNDTVGLLCRNSFEANEIMLASWLGALPVAPIDGFMKVLELKHTLGLIRPKILFCEEIMTENVASAAECLVTPPIIVVVDKSVTSGRSVRYYKDLKKIIEIENFQAEAVASPTTQILVIPPSSGTTGLPKGIGLTHKNMIFQDKIIECTGYFSGNSTMLQTSQFFWMTGLIGFLRSFSVGMKRIFLKSYTPEGALNAISKYKANFGIMAPLTLLALTTCPKFHEYDKSDMKYIILTGSLLKESTAKSIKQEWPELNLYQVYGMTETSGVCCYTRELNSSVGKICPGIELKVLDLNTGKSLEPNASGEICLRCEGVMKFYVGMEGETKATVDEYGWVHTGDVGYFDNSGWVYIVDRIKEIIKVKDMQVSPAEIESVIEALPGVLEAGVVGLPQENGSYLIMGLVVKEMGSNLTEDDICSCVEGTLSDYKKLTAGVHFVDSIPQTTNGKINRGQLKAMAQNLYRA